MVRHRQAFRLSGYESTVEPHAVVRAENFNRSFSRKNRLRTDGPCGGIVWTTSWEFSFCESRWKWIFERLSWLLWYWTFVELQALVLFIVAVGWDRCEKKNVPNVCIHYTGCHLNHYFSSIPFRQLQDNGLHTVDKNAFADLVSLERL